MTQEEKIKIKLMAPLLYFYFDDDSARNVFPYDIGEGFSIERIENTDYFTQFMKRISVISEYDRSQIRGFKYVLVCNYEASSLDVMNITGSRIYKEVEDTKNLIRMALGLTKGSNITFPTFHIKLGDASSPLVTMAHNREPTRWKYSDVTYRESDLETLKLLIQKIRPLSNDSHNRILNACVYFETGRRSGEYIVRFIMLISALESLFNSSTDHISETVAMRCASIITLNQSTRLDYYKRIKDVYKMRSFLVHGQDIPNAFKDKDRQLLLIHDAEYFARQSILTIFRNDSESSYLLKNKEFNEYFASILFN